jgi:hypothetical protein
MMSHNVIQKLKQEICDLINEVYFLLSLLMFEYYEIFQIIPEA